MVLKGILKLTGLVAVVLLITIILPVDAAMPAYTGLNYPNTFWARMDYTNTVAGKVIASSGTSHGIEGAYVAIVNASNTSEEYANTTSAADGSYSFLNVNATYYQKADRYDPQYKIYAYRADVGEAYSQSFGIDVAAVSKPMEMWVVMPVNVTAVPTTGVASVTATPTPVPSPTPAPIVATTAAPKQSWTWKHTAIIVGVIAIVLAGAGAYLYLRRRR